MARNANEGHGIDLQKAFNGQSEESQQKVLDGLIASDVKKMNEKKRMKKFIDLAKMKLINNLEN